MGTKIESNDIMLDIETAATHPGAVVLSIGAVQFDPMTGETGLEFECNIDFQSSIDEGFEYTADALKWWFTQPSEAFVCLTKNAKPIEEALLEFDKFVKDVDPTDAYVWGNGAAFDNVIVSEAYRRLGIEKSWKYRNDMDMRTIVRLAEGFIDPSSVLFQGTKHRALDDAKHQVKIVSLMYSAIRNSLGKTYGTTHTLTNPRQ